MRTILFFLLTLILLGSCSKNFTDVDQNSETGTAQVEFSFVNGSADSRAFFDDKAVAETWEKSLTSVTIYVFAQNGELITERKFTATEVAAKSASMAVPLGFSETACEFFAVANEVFSGIANKSDIIAKLETQPQSYNGAFAEVSTKSIRPDGFVMTGSTTKTIGGAGTSTSVEITLKRTVAKIASQIAVDESFGQKYSGTLSVKNVKITDAAAQTPYFYKSALSTGNMNYSHSQTPLNTSGKYNTLFYIYENGPLAAGNRVQMEIVAEYDADGNPATTTDIREVVYNIELSGSSATGRIDRNGYYRVAINITGLSGDELNLSVNVADWETPTTQDVNIGM